MKKAEEKKKKVPVNILHKTAMIILLALLAVQVLPFCIPLRLGATEIPEKPFPHSAFETIDGRKLHYEMFMPRSTTERGNILLIHGMRGSTFSWRFTMPALADAGYRVVAVDLPAFGYSTRNVDDENYYESTAKLLWKLIDHLNGTETKWHLTGHSLGATLAAWMYKQKPYRVQSFQFVGGAVMPASDGPMKWLLRYPPLDRYVQLFLRYVAYRRKYVYKSTAAMYRQEPQEDVVLQYFKPLQIKGTPQAVAAIWKAEKENLVPIIAQSQVKAMLVWGSRDTVVPPDAGKQLHQAMKSSVYKEITGAGHCPMETHSKIFNTLYIEFLQQSSS